MITHLITHMLTPMEVIWTSYDFNTRFIWISYDYSCEIHMHNHMATIAESCGNHMEIIGFAANSRATHNLYMMCVCTAAGVVHALASAQIVIFICLLHVSALGPDRAEYRPVKTQTQGFKEHRGKNAFRHQAEAPRRSPRKAATRAPGRPARDRSSAERNLSVVSDGLPL